MQYDPLIKENSRLTPAGIKSAGTFSTDFIRRLDRIQALGIAGTTAPAVLYAGEQRLDVCGVRVFNPLLWETRTALVAATDAAAVSRHLAFNGSPG